MREAVPALEGSIMSHPFPVVDVIIAWMASSVRSYPIGMMMGKIVMVYHVDSSGMAKMLEKA